MASKIFMIIDDDPDDREFFQEALNSIDSSARCLTALNGEDALVKLSDSTGHLPDYIFLDLNMPRMDGKSFLREMMKDFKLKHIPVTIFSTSSDPRDLKETQDLGAVHYIVKPYDFNKLCNEITFVIGRI